MLKSLKVFPEDKNPRFKNCAGLASNKYISRDSVRHDIEVASSKRLSRSIVDFCDLNLNQPISQRYHEGSLEDVIISLDYNCQNPDPSVLTRQSCVRYLGGELTDGCDIPDPAANPNNYKGGGTASLGDVTYRIEPQAQRQPAMQGKMGGCDSTYKFLFNEYTVWGRAWLNDDHGDTLYHSIQTDCGAVTNWGFSYGLSNDGREWTAWFRQPVGHNKCVSWQTHQVGAPDGFEC